MKERQYFLALHQALQKDVYAEIDFPMSRADLNTAAQSYLKFLALPTEVKKPFIAKRIIERKRGGHMGLRERKKETGQIDNKNYWHHNRYFPERFAEALTEPLHPTVKDFLAWAEKIYEIGEKEMTKIIRAFETEYPEIYAAYFPEGEYPHFSARFLAYHVEGKGQFLAKAHFDRGKATLAIAESGPGLRMGTGPNDLREVEHKEGQALFMPAIRFHEETDGKKVYAPVWHDVVQAEEDAHEEGTARWAIVFFCNTLHGADEVTHEDAHPW